MTTTERLHLRDAARIVRTIHNHLHGINTDGSIQLSSGWSVKANGDDQNWYRIREMIDKWMREEPKK